MFLSRFEIHRARREARKLLGSPQAMHAAVCAGFPPADPSGPGRILWRVDDDGRRALLYVVSPTRPDLTHLVEQAGWPTLQGWETRSYSGFLGSLSCGQRWAFRLAANPTRSTRLAGQERSQRLGHVTAVQQRGWALARAASWGVELLPVGDDVAVRVSHRGARGFRRQGATVTLTTAVFEGQFVVTDPDRLRAALTRGIGPAKAYGCGLMTLAPIEAGV
jgi:CRISPR system Cascade subunit CasE